MTEAVQDKPTMTCDWDRLPPQIEGVLLKRTRNIITGSSVTTELFRRDWDGIGYPVDHSMHVNLSPRAITAWHHHKKQIDHFFIVRGRIKLVLYDDREASPTRGMVNVFRLGEEDPCMVRIPTLVWHGIQNLLDDSSAFLNFTNPAYQYEDPDEWRLPPDTDQIPYRF